MRAFFLASLLGLLVGVPVGAAAREGWFVRVCPAKTEANPVPGVESTACAVSSAGGGGALAIPTAPSPRWKLSPVPD